MSLIEVKGLKKSFGKLEVIKGIDLTVEKGERIAIIGGSGCGKSVFLRSLCLLEKPDAGEIFIDGREITARDADVDDIRRSMGMVFQKFHLFSEMDVMDNLCLAPVRLKKMPRAEAEAKAMELLAQVGLSSRAHAWPTVLSGGQQQRIAICRCLMMEPKVLLFDEPTSALDPTMVGEVLAVIRMLAKQDMSMLIVTHEMNFAREVAGRVLFLADGGIYEQGTPAEIFDSPKGEKTIAFVNKIKYFSYDIMEKAFDLMNMQGGIQVFGEKYGLNQRQIHRLQICCEELIFEMMENCYPGTDKVDIHIEVTYAELDKTEKIFFSCGGKKHDPFDAADPGLGVTILNKVAKHISHRYEKGINLVEITL
ncbi:MAG: amino acid ABC transporter ATP-binding protein [Lachnospiraceae bacterium]|nr:amino acid ABC transporter ATP-binding protein [Lachnospiraceae bacterium]